MPSGSTASARRRFSENNPGSQPVEITLTLPPLTAAAFTFSKYSGILACVSKLSTVLNNAANSGPCSGKSVAEPPQRIITSISPLYFSISEMCTTPFAAATSSGCLLEKIAFNSMSGFCLIAFSTPRPKLPYPTIPTLMFAATKRFLLQIQICLPF
ncbi:hypothetical protein D1872_226200 [compost metagenome]